MDLNKFFYDKILKGEYTYAKSIYKKIENKEDVEDYIKHRISVSMAKAYHNDFSRYFFVENVKPDEFSCYDEDYIKITTEVVIMNRLELFQLMQHLLTVTGSEKELLLNKLQTKIEYEKNGQKKLEEI